MQARVAVAALFSVVTLGACSSDTAIVLSIHGTEARSQGATRLEIYLGSGAVDPVGSDQAFPASWWRRAVVDPQTVAVDNPSLGDRTYDFLLTPASGIALDAEVVYAVVAYGPAVGGEEIVGFAHSDDFIRFHDGEIRRIDVPMAGYDRAQLTAGVTSTGCAWWNAIGRAGPAATAIRDRAIVPLGDLDCDDYRGDVPAGCGLAGDCDEADPTINPGQRQGCTAVDTDCCDTTPGIISDEDGDGVKVCEGDCVDVGAAIDIFGQSVPAAAIHPGQIDTTCNGVDEACARDVGGGCDGGVVDPDGDGYVTCRLGTNLVGSVRQENCHTFTVPDCLESGSAGGVPASEIHPEAEDVECDGVDQDCDHHCDNGAPLDVDQDGFSRCPNTGDVLADAGGAPICAARIADCEDGDPWQRPGLVEACDGIDFMCDGVFSNNRQACLPTVTAPGACTVGSAACAESANGMPAYGACQPIPGGPMLPDSWCQPCNGNDPLLCESDTRFRTCGIHTMPSTGTTACASPFQQVTMPSCVNCNWSIENGTDVNGWRVTLVDALTTSTTAPPAATFFGTNVVLRAMITGPGPQGFLIKRITEQGVTSFDVIQLRHDQQACTAVACIGGG